jgi:hypothetical protein
VATHAPVTLASPAKDLSPLRPADRSPPAGSSEMMRRVLKGAKFTRPTQISSRKYPSPEGEKKWLRSSELAEREGFEPSVPFLRRYTRFPVALLRPTRTSLRNRTFAFDDAMFYLAERVGFEPTCPAFNGTSRFRVDPVTTTSVPLLHRSYGQGFPRRMWKKSCIRARHSDSMIPDVTSTLWFRSLSETKS